MVEIFQLKRRKAIVDDFGSLFESKFLPGSEQTDRFANALLARLQPLRRMNPDDEVAAMAGREFLKELPSLAVFFEGISDVVRQNGDGRFCGVGILRWRRCEAGRREQVRGLEFGPPFSIKIRPLA